MTSLVLKKSHYNFIIVVIFGWIIREGRKWVVSIYVI